MRLDQGGAADTSSPSMAVTVKPLTFGDEYSQREIPLAVSLFGPLKSRRRRKAFRVRFLRPSISRLLVMIMVTLCVLSVLRRGRGSDTWPIPFMASAQVDDGQCSAARRTREDGRHKSVYRIGVLAIRGEVAAWAEFNRTYGDYLTATAGNRFDPPITFEMEPLNFITLFTDVEEDNIDFFYVNPSAYSCIESQYGAHSLVSQISRRVVGGNIYHLTMFGGVIFTLSDNDSINTIQDLRDKSVAAASISGLGSGQMQARVLQQQGLSYINDPAQLTFTSNQGKVVNGVLKGDFEVGWVRTDQIERTKDASTGQLVDKSKIKIIEPIPGLDIDGEPFPFDSSTPLYAEWNIAALPTVPNDVAIELQAAMLALADYADVGGAISSCIEKSNCTGILSTECENNCGQSAINDYLARSPQQCDVTQSLALLAHDARKRGKYAGWRSTLSYMELRNMQEETGFISRNDMTGTMECVRSKKIYDAIVCPPGHFKKSPEQVDSGCANANRTCGKDFQCICKPCVKAFEVDVFPVMVDGEVRGRSLEGSVRGCEKMSLCGTVQQTKIIRFRVIDNKKREGLQLDVTVHEGDSTRSVGVNAVGNTANSSSYTYEFDVSARRIGVVILEIFADGVQSPESPLRVQVASRTCAEETGDPLSVATQDGDCKCVANSVSMGGICVSLAVLLPAILVPLCFVVGIGVYLYVDHKRKQADSVWAVKTSELHFDDPPVIIGRGTFGLVLLAEYRGTQVAVKRVIPPRISSQGHRSARKDSTFGKGDDSEDVDMASRGSLSAGKRSSDAFFDLTDQEVVELEKMEKGKVHRRASWVEADETSANANDNFNDEGTRSGAYMGSGAFNSGAFKSGSGAFNSLASTSDNGGHRYLHQKIGDKLKKRDEYQKLKTDFILEMRHLSKLRHPCITTVMGAVISKKEEPMLIMEYMDHGSLYDLLHNETMFIEGEFLLPILRDIAQGIRFLHSATPKVIHGDLKAQNVLVDSKFRVKVADFGLSQKKTVGATGTPFWMAPELLRGEAENSASSDVYSFGIILYEVYSRKDPYEGERARDVLKLVTDPKVNKRPPVPAAMPQQVASLMTDCLVSEAQSRPNAEEVDLRLKRLDVENVEPGVITPSYHTRKDVKSEELLYEVFPKHIADALRDGRRVEPESKECVTIFFSDIVGFTTISTTMEALKVSNMLDRLYQRFDELSRRHDVHKIDTIGDAFMAVTNLVKDQPDDHVKRIAEFSIDAMEAAEETEIDLEDPSKGTVRIRVGFHSGPCVADVIGTRSPKYTIFGDTVNTSSRMESNSLPGRIQCSDESAALLKLQAPEMPILKRGTIRVKGKGEMRTYWVNEARSDSNKSLNSDSSTRSSPMEQGLPRRESIGQGTGKQNSRGKGIMRESSEGRKKLKRSLSLKVSSH